MPGLSARAQAMSLLRIAREAGAAAAAVDVVQAATRTTAGEGAVDWQAAAEQLRALVDGLPAVPETPCRHGIALYEGENEDGNDRAA